MVNIGRDMDSVCVCLERKQGLREYRSHSIGIPYVHKEYKDSPEFTQGRRFCLYWEHF